MASKNVFIALICALLVAWTVPSAGQGEPLPPLPIHVEYIHPEKFTDVGSRYFRNDELRTAYLEQLSKHLTGRAAPLLPAGQILTVTITEVDMAGTSEPTRRYLSDVRIFRDVYPPRIDLRFKLTGADGVVLKQGERKLRDLTYLTTTNVYRDDPLRFEKALLDTWLERELPRPAT